jgi:DNA-binding response OmpR family regulator
VSERTPLTALLVAPARLVSGLRSMVEQLGPNASRTVRVVATGEPVVSLVERAHRAVPAFGVVVVAIREDEVDGLLALGADEVLVEPIYPGELANAVRRSALRAALRDDHAVESRTLQQVLGGLAQATEGSLTALSLDIDALRCTADDLASDDRAALDDCARAIDRVSRTLRDASAFAPCDGEWSPEPVAVAVLIDQVLRFLGGTLDQCTPTHVERDEEDGLPLILAPRRPLTRILSHVLVHALDAVEPPEDTKALRRLRIATRADHESVAIVIEALPGLDAPPTSTPRSLGAVGALAVAREALRTFEGELIGEQAADGGVRFVIFLARPREGLPAMTSRGLGATVEPRARRPRVLLVQPDERILRAAARALDDRFDVLLATTGEEALTTVLEERGVDALVIDAQLPDMTAAMLVEELGRRRRDLVARVLLVAGEGQSGRRLPVPIGLPVLEKPLRRASLVAALETLLGAPSKVRALPTPDLN